MRQEPQNSFQINILRAFLAANSFIGLSQDIAQAISLSMDIAAKLLRRTCNITGQFGERLLPTINYNRRREHQMKRYSQIGV
jgi:hypothetical protein